MRDETCPQCQVKEQWFQLDGLRWDVTKARRFTQGRATYVATPEQLILLGLPLLAQRVHPFQITINESHLLHIPEEKLREPILIAPLQMSGSTKYQIIDGAHRSVRLARSGQTVTAVLLTARESLSCMVGLDRDTRRQWAIFPGIERLPRN